MLEEKISFGAYGPFHLGKNKEPEEWNKIFIDKAEEPPEGKKGLSKAIGCYVFGMDSGKSLQPWYVGRTTKQCFENEIFSGKKPVRYAKVVYPIIKQRPRGMPFIMVFPLLTSKRKNFSKNKSNLEDAIKWLEDTLITMALARNSDLLNKSSTKHPRIVSVTGIFGNRAGRPSSAAQVAKKVFGL